jgi:hypothetical protein
MPNWVEIEHPEVDLTAVVSESALDELDASGWKRVGDAAGPDQPGRPKGQARSAAKSNIQKKEG